MTDATTLRFLHPGYPKGASTYLHKSMFTTENGIVNLFVDPVWERFLNLSLLRMQWHGSAGAG